MPTFLEDLPGIRDLQWEDQQALPRRSLINLVGAVTVADNPGLGSTDITFDAPETAGETQTHDVSGNITQYSPEEPSLRLASMVRWVPLTATTLHAVTASARPLMVFVNAGNFGLTLAHDSVGASGVSGRFLCPGNTAYILAPGYSVIVVRDEVSGRWRVVL